MEEMVVNVSEMFGSALPRRTKKRRVKVPEALTLLEAEEVDKLIDSENVIQEAMSRTMQSGMVFIDEIDKVTSRGQGTGGPDVSREGVQRDLLPVVEGSTVTTKHGPVRTDHILFIASGAFHAARPSDLIPELQGRFPIRVELDSLGSDEFVRILTEPENALCRQYVALMHTENVELEFSTDGIKEIAHIATRANETMENIGARRLHTVLEKVVDELSFAAPEIGAQKVVVTAHYVQQRLSKILADQDLSRYIL
jgi:ATP-dependent HslUV protease ATP-binding subunit HslU